MEILHRILVIDDDVLLTEILSTVFERAGYGVAIVNDAKEAVSTALTFRPDFILIDYDLSGTTGAEILRQLRSTPWA